MDNKIAGRRRLGRPKNIWKKGVLKDISDIEIKVW